MQIKRPEVLMFDDLLKYRDRRRNTERGTASRDRRRVRFDFRPSLFPLDTMSDVRFRRRIARSLPLYQAAPGFKNVPRKRAPPNGIDVVVHEFAARIRQLMNPAPTFGINQLGDGSGPRRKLTPCGITVKLNGD